MTNMCNAHTCSIGSLDMVLSTVGLLHGEFVEVVGEMICSPRISIPVGINRVGGRGRGRAATAGNGESSQLTIHVPAVVASTQVVALESFEAAGGNMAHLGADLAGGARATRRSAALIRTATTVDRKLLCRWRSRRRSSR